MKSLYLPSTEFDGPACLPFLQLSQQETPLLRLMLLLCAFLLGGQSTVVFAQGVAFQATTLPRQVRGEGKTETIGELNLLATNSGTIVAGSSITITYPAGITNTVGAANCAGVCGVVSFAGGTITLAYTADTPFGTGNTITISGVRLDASSVGVGGTLINASVSGLSASPTTNPITIINPVAPVGVVVAPSLSANIPKAGTAPLAVSTCSPPASSGSANFRMTVTEQIPSALTTAAQETSFSNTPPASTGTFVTIVFSGVPKDFILTPTDTGGTSGTLLLGLPGSVQSVGSGSPITFTFVISATDTASVETIDLGFNLGTTGGAPIPFGGGSGPITATVSIGPVNSGAILDFAGNLQASGTVANVTDCITPPTVQITSAATSSLCSPSVPAAISGSTGEQGVLDPDNTIPPDQPEGGLVWPAGAVGATILLDTGEVVFTDSGGAVVGTDTLPGVNGVYPAFPDGKLNFTRVRLPANKFVVVGGNAVPQVAFTPFLGTVPPAVVLSCEDIVLESGSIFAVSADGFGVVTIPINGTPVVFPGAFSAGVPSPPAAGFGPRTSGAAAAGSLYPPLGGAGGASGSGVSCGLAAVCPDGGFGGGALVMAAAQRLTVNGTIQATAGAGIGGAQGGGGGSVRLAGLLVEGTGTINTSAGLDSDGVKRSPDGPIEIQAFVQAAFAGTTTTSPISGNPVVAALPSNLPTIAIVYVAVTGAGDFCGLDCSNTGSLTVPDVALPGATSAQTVDVEAQTTGVPQGTQLVFRAVGTDGSVSETTGAVVAQPPCTSGGEGACVTLNLNPGATYQIVVTPTSAFGLARRPEAVPLGGGRLIGAAAGSGPQELQAARWARALGADPRKMGEQVARVTVRVSGE